MDGRTFMEEMEWMKGNIGCCRAYCPFYPCSKYSSKPANLELLWVAGVRSLLLFLCVFIFLKTTRLPQRRFSSLFPPLGASKEVFTQRYFILFFQYSWVALGGFQPKSWTQVPHGGFHLGLFISSPFLLSKSLVIWKPRLLQSLALPCWCCWLIPSLIRVFGRILTYTH